jgi:hypothetical protein
MPTQGEPHGSASPSEQESQDNAAGTSQAEPAQPITPAKASNNQSAEEEEESPLNYRRDPSSISPIGSVPQDNPLHAETQQLFESVVDETIQRGAVLAQHFAETHRLEACDEAIAAAERREQSQLLNPEPSPLQKAHESVARSRHIDENDDDDEDSNRPSPSPTPGSAKKPGPNKRPGN